MKIKHVMLSAAVSLLAVPALADDDWKQVDNASNAQAREGESKTREQVREELAAWLRNPVTADGWKQTAGDGVWVYVGDKATAESRQK